MITLILPGYSINNKEWAEETARNLKLGGQIRPVSWDHWTDPTKKFDKKEKARMLTDVTGEDEVNIIAKSIGTLVAAYIIKSIYKRINKVIFVGLPMTDLETEDKLLITEALRLLPTPKIMCLQNSNDPHGSFEEAKDFIISINSEIKIYPKDGSDHNYPYYSDFQKFLF